MYSIYIHDMMHNVYVLMSDIHDTQYLLLVSMIHNTYAWYRTIFMLHIHDIQYLCLVSICIHNVYIWYPRYAILKYGFNDGRDLCLDP